MSTETHHSLHTSERKTAKLKNETRFGESWQHQLLRYYTYSQHSTTTASRQHQHARAELERGVSTHFTHWHHTDVTPRVD